MSESRQGLDDSRSSVSQGRDGCRDRGHQRGGHPHDWDGCHGHRGHSGEGWHVGNAPETYGREKHRLVLTHTRDGAHRGCTATDTSGGAPTPLGQPSQPRAAPARHRNGTQGTGTAPHRGRTAPNSPAAAAKKGIVCLELSEEQHWQPQGGTNPQAGTEAAGLVLQPFAGMTQGKANGESTGMRGAEG